MEKIYNKYIFFRNDDVNKVDKNLGKLLNIFINNQIPITLSVIPQKLSKKCCNYLSDIIKNHKNIIDIGQHGFYHCNYSKSKNVKYEFGPMRNYKEQEMDIKTGKKILREKLGIDSKIFIPPWNGFDKNTLKILVKDGFTIISTDIKHSLRGDSQDLENIFTNVYWNKKANNGSWITESPDRFIKEIIFNKSSFVGIEMHHPHFKNNEDFKRLNFIINELKKDKNIKFIHLHESRNYLYPNKNIDKKSLMYYLTYQFVPKPLTLLKGQVNPIHKSYDFSYIKNIKFLQRDEIATAKKLYMYLKRVVENMLPRNRKPIGLLLSGGLDSSVILHLLRGGTDRKIYTITASYNKDSRNISICKSLSKKYGTIHHSIFIKPDALKMMESVYSKKIPQPIGDSGFLANYILYDKLKKYTNLIFSGDGGDCLFSGLKMHLLNFVDTLRRKGMSNIYGHYRFDEIFLSREELKTFFGNEFSHLNLGSPLIEVTNKIKIEDILKRQVLIDLRFLVRNRIDYLIYSSKICNVRLFLPYLERDFVNFAVKIPSRYLIKDFQQKYILRKAFEDKLPQEVINRKKVGFSPPFRLWYEENKEFVIKKLIKSIKLGIPKSYIKYLISIIPKSNNYTAGMKIWLILNLVCWYEKINK